MYEKCLSDYKVYNLNPPLLSCTIRKQVEVYYTETSLITIKIIQRLVKPRDYKYDRKEKSKGKFDNLLSL